jgi:hypothetical protein
MRIQRHQGGTQRNRMKGLLILIAILLIVGTGAWLLNICGILQGPWSNIFGALSTILGLILGFLQWYSQSSSVIPSTSMTSTQRALDSEHRVGTQLIVENILKPSKNRATLVVYTGKHLRGETINLSCGFETLHLKTYAATNIVERKIHGQTTFVGIFPSLEPGNYIVHDDSRKLLSKVTVTLGHITEIDWRHNKLLTQRNL